MNRRRFIQALTAAGVVAAVGVDLQPYWRAEQIAPLLKYSVTFNPWTELWTAEAYFADDTHKFMLEGVYSRKPTDEDREHFMDLAAHRLTKFANDTR